MLFIWAMATLTVMMAIGLGIKSKMNHAGLNPQACSGRSLMNAESQT
jgi:hypothetical protein